MANWRDNHKNPLYREIYNRDWLNHELRLWQRYTKNYLDAQSAARVVNDSIDIEIRDLLYTVANLNGISDNLDGRTQDESIYHIAHLTALLKETEWQVSTNLGSAWLAQELYKRGARTPFGHFHV